MIVVGDLVSYLMLLSSNLNVTILFIQAETRAEFAERSVQKLQKEVDRLEGKSTDSH